MARTRDPNRRTSDWSTWAAGSRGVEVERLEQELAESRASERRARLEAAERRDRFERLLDASRRFTRTLSDRRRQQQRSRQIFAAQHAIDGLLAEVDDLEDAAARLEDTRREPRLAGGRVLGGRRGDVALHRGLAPTRCRPRRFRGGVPPDGLHAW